MKKTNNTRAIYQTKSGSVELREDVQNETLWATQSQIAEIFSIERSVVTKHIGNILRSKEINQKSNVQKMHIANSDKPVSTYSLDMILAVGYRASSSKAIAFRQWASKVLREHITRGYTLNPKVIKNHYAEFQIAIKQLKQVLPTGISIDHASVLELISTFADTWFSLEAYDKDRLVRVGTTKKSIAVTSEQLSGALNELKSILIEKNEATELFGEERMAGSVKGIIGNVMQSFGGKAVYPSVEEKAAHLLYFLVKDHPFVDGNKRSGAYAFIWFLRRANALDLSRMTPSALTALTLLVAVSEPKDKNKMIGLILIMLSKAGQDTSI
ncbi:MAG: virulence protein RhuM/Fic/DOC family protein [Candidatus Uhrbacteria bacterium]